VSGVSGGRCVRIRLFERDFTGGNRGSRGERGRKAGRQGFKQKVAKGRKGRRQGGRKSGLNPPSLFELWLGTQKIAKVAKEDAGERDESCSGEECFI
jgi:hypothetical protein